MANNLYEIINIANKINQELSKNNNGLSKTMKFFASAIRNNNPLLDLLYELEIELNKFNPSEIDNIQLFSLVKMLNNIENKIKKSENLDISQEKIVMFSEIMAKKNNIFITSIFKDRNIESTIINALSSEKIVLNNVEMSFIEYMYKIIGDIDVIQTFESSLNNNNLNMDENFKLYESSPEDIIKKNIKLESTKENVLEKIISQFEDKLQNNSFLRKTDISEIITGKIISSSNNPFGVYDKLKVYEEYLNTQNVIELQNYVINNIKIEHVLNNLDYFRDLSAKNSRFASMIAYTSFREEYLMDYFTGEQNTIEETLEKIEELGKLYDMGLVNKDKLEKISNILDSSLKIKILNFLAEQENSYDLLNKVYDIVNPETKSPIELNKVKNFLESNITENIIANIKNVPITELDSFIENLNNKNYTKHINFIKIYDAAIQLVTDNTVKQKIFTNFSEFIKNAEIDLILENFDIVKQHLNKQNKEIIVKKLLDSSLKSLDSLTNIHDNIKNQKPHLVGEPSNYIKLIRDNILKINQEINQQIPDELRDDFAKSVSKNSKTINIINKFVKDTESTIGTMIDGVSFTGELTELDDYNMFKIEVDAVNIALTRITHFEKPFTDLNKKLQEKRANLLKNIIDSKNSVKQIERTLTQLTELSEEFVEEAKYIREGLANKIIFESDLFYEINLADNNSISNLTKEYIKKTFDEKGALETVKLYEALNKHITNPDEKKIAEENKIFLIEQLNDYFLFNPNNFAKFNENYNNINKHSDYINMLDLISEGTIILSDTKLTSEIEMAVLEHLIENINKEKSGFSLSEQKVNHIMKNFSDEHKTEKNKMYVRYLNNKIEKLKSSYISEEEINQINKQIKENVLDKKAKTELIAKLTQELVNISISNPQAFSTLKIDEEITRSILKGVTISDAKQDNILSSPNVKTHSKHLEIIYKLTKLITNSIDFINSKIFNSSKYIDLVENMKKVEYELKDVNIEKGLSYILQDLFKDLKENNYYSLEANLNLLQEELNSQNKGENYIIGNLLGELQEKGDSYLLQNKIKMELVKIAKDDIKDKNQGLSNKLMELAEQANNKIQGEDQKTFDNLKVKVENKDNLTREDLSKLTKLLIKNIEQTNQKSGSFRG